MRLITMTRDMRPYFARHDYAVPDLVAEMLIRDGHAKESPKHASSGLKPDQPAPPPARLGLLARRAKA